MKKSIQKFSKGLSLALLGLCIGQQPMAQSEQLRLSGIMESESGKSFALIEQHNGTSYEEKIYALGEKVDGGTITRITGNKVTISYPNVFPKRSIDLVLERSGRPTPQLPEDSIITGTLKRDALEDILLVINSEEGKPHDKLEMINSLLGIPKDHSIIGINHMSAVEDTLNTLSREFANPGSTVTILEVDDGELGVQRYYLTHQ